jgi:hypothetical protein
MRRLHSSYFLHFIKYYESDQIKEDEISGACNTHIKNGIEIECECVEWIYLAQDRVQWQVLVTKIINLFHKRRGIY